MPRRCRYAIIYATMLMPFTIDAYAALSHVARHAQDAGNGCYAFTRYFRLLHLMPLFTDFTLR